MISYLFLKNLCISNQLVVLLCAINTSVLHRSVFHMANSVECGLCYQEKNKKFSSWPGFACGNHELKLKQRIGFLKLE